MLTLVCKVAGKLKIGHFLSEEEDIKLLMSRASLTAKLRRAEI
jgi:hypothetical protein